MELPTVSTKSVTEILLSTKKEDGTDLVTKDQAEVLVNLKFKESKEKILTNEDRYFLYEMIWLLQDSDIGYEGTYNFLTTNWEKLLGTHNIRKKILFENPLLAPNREKFALDMELYRNKIDIEEGGETCPKCQGSSTVSVSKQMRSADEMTAIYVFCTDCKYNWYAQ